MYQSQHSVRNLQNVKIVILILLLLLSHSYALNQKRPSHSKRLFAEYPTLVESHVHLLCNVIKIQC